MCLLHPYRNLKSNYYQIKKWQSELIFRVVILLSDYFFLKNYLIDDATPYYTPCIKRRKTASTK